MTSIPDSRTPTSAEQQNNERKPRKPLTDRAIREAKPAAKPYKLYDERGLLLLVTPTGKLWRLKYRINGVEKLLSLGKYPDTSLAAARKKRDKERELIAEGVDPSAVRREKRDASANTFELIAREWFDRFKGTWTPGHSETVESRMENNLFPFIGNKPIRDITAPELLSVLRKIESRGAYETTRRVRQICGKVFRYAITTGRADRDPSADLRDALTPTVPVHRAAITDPKAAGELLRVLDSYDGTAVVSAALRLAPLVFVRPGELRKAEWTEINLDAAQWTIPAWRMKMRQTLTVPLSRQAVAILRDLHAVTGHGKYVFPSGRTSARPMSDNAVLAAFRRSGITKDEMTGHGFRAMARTILDEVLKFRPDLIEHQLGHAVKDPNGRAYNRTSFLAERTEMMQVWADYLDQVKGDPVAREQQMA
ncbi:MAG TPA: integrase arm-type DNA-binding domain-containing protein [Thermoanaerobaculia bacterium]|jgi:integrase|nr:integrase arm-type DNA-binding domain-containing protein [Thermoanaerobaculia bacterium]